MEWLKLIHGSAHPAVSFTTGDDVRVWFKIREQGKERLAQFEGVVLRVRGNSSERTFTVRRLTHGEGVERVFPVDAPVIARIELLRRGKAKRSRLYFLRHVVKRTRLATEEGPATGGPIPATESPKGAAPPAPEGRDAMVAAEPSSG